jgi:rubrerythrin
MPIFKADEVFEMAEQMERDGAKFYRKAAESADEPARTLLLDLATMEDDHKKTFAAMRRDLPHDETESPVLYPDNQAVKYLQAMVAGKVFAEDPSEALSGAESIATVFETAIELEKSAIVFYQSLKSAAPKEFGQEQIDEIIDEEIGHILTLTKQFIEQS